MHIHTLGEAHSSFLSEKRLDPITREEFKTGDRVVVCANDKFVFLADVWNAYGHCPECNGTRTLNHLPLRNFRGSSRRLTLRSNTRSPRSASRTTTTPRPAPPPRTNATPRPSTNNRIDGLSSFKDAIFAVIGWIIVISIAFFLFKQCDGEKDDVIPEYISESSQEISASKSKNTSIPTINESDNTYTDTDNVIIPTDSDNDGVVDTLDECSNTVTNIVVNDVGCPNKVEIVDTLEMQGRIFFDINSSYIEDKYLSDLEKIAEKMLEYPTATAVVEGHAASKEANPFNEDLAEMRAYNVIELLIENYGIDSSRITAKIYGSSRPIAPNDTREQQEMNSRVYIYVKGKKTQNSEQTKDMEVQ